MSARTQSQSESRPTPSLEDRVEANRRMIEAVYGEAERNLPWWRLLGCAICFVSGIVSVMIAYVIYRAIF